VDGRVVSSDVVRGDLRFVHLLVFHAYINEMQCSRSKMPSKKSRQAALQRDLIPALKGLECKSGGHLELW
jgi:hypothetical protein